MDLSEITPRLYVGSSFYPPNDDDGIDWSLTTIIDVGGVIPRHFPKPEGAKLISAHFADGPEVPDAVHALAASGIAALGRGENVVCLCGAGRNRSGLVAAAILMECGWSAEEAITEIRNARSWSLRRSAGALTNRAFVDWLSRARV